MCDDWRPLLTAPMGRRILLLLAALPGEEEDAGEVCSGFRLDDGTFRRSHGDKGQVDPVAWCYPPAAPESYVPHTRLRYEPRRLPWRGKERL